MAPIIIETSADSLEIPESHKRSIDIGITQIKSGQTISNEEVMKRVQQWAGK